MPQASAKGRKRRETRERIIAVVMSLFLEKGYERVPVREIAAASNVTPRNFFYHFHAKEDVVSFWQDKFGDALVAAVAARPARESIVVVVEEALSSAIAAISSRDVAIDRMVSRTPALIYRELLKYRELEDSLAGALTQRVRGDRAKFRAQLLALIIVGTLRLASADWRSCGDSASSVVVTYSNRQIFETLWAELRDIGASGLRLQ